MIAGERAHLQLYEAGAAAAISGLQFAHRGAAAGCSARPRSRPRSCPPTPTSRARRIVCVENTHNRSGGRVFPLDDVRAIGALAHARGLARHLDGARIFNAEVATRHSGARVGRALRLGVVLPLEGTRRADRLARCAARAS